MRGYGVGGSYNVPRDTRNLIARIARRHHIDPAAALSVAYWEGGFNPRKALGDYVGGRATSFGPFALHEGGALPRSHYADARQWANSPAGIRYAIRQMQQVAKGKRGRKAISNIVSRFERPADPATEIARAISAYGKFRHFNKDQGNIPPLSRAHRRMSAMSMAHAMNRSAFANPLKGSPELSDSTYDPSSGYMRPAFASGELLQAEQAARTPSQYADEGYSTYERVRAAASPTPVPMVPAISMIAGRRGRRGRPGRGAISAPRRTVSMRSGGGGGPLVQAAAGGFGGYVAGKHHRKIIGTPYSGTHTLGNWESDNAIDIAMPKGTPLYAAFSGSIGSQFGSLGSGGRFAGLRLHLQGKHDELYYAHLSRFARGIRPGRRVRKGQLIGFSGVANGVEHLHLGDRSGRYIRRRYL